jgi:putative colanic acid biosynthesis acetyltransferase WcaF
MTLTNKSPFHNPSFKLQNRLMRSLWNLVYALLFWPSPRPMHTWRVFLLTFFGARIGQNCHFYPRCKVWAPWNLMCGNFVGVADGVEIYNPKKIIIDDYVTVSQRAYLCGASHDVDDSDFPLIADEIHIGKRAWICAHATVLLGVRVGEGSVLGLSSLATKDLEPWTVYGGVPAQKIRKRKIDKTFVNK